MTLPIIGLTPISHEDKYHIRMNYINAVSRENGIPIIMPFLIDDAKIKALVDSIDGLLLSGGSDVNPAMYGENPHQKLGYIETGRDAYEMKLIDYTLAQGKPILGICRGAQILNIHQGGKMYQDIYDQREDETMGHNQKALRSFTSHEITVVEGTKLHEIIGKSKIQTNSFHHQANKVLSENFVVSALANDGIIEAIESTEHDFVIGVQWHPEDLYDNDEAAQKLFRKFIEVADK